MRAMSRPIASLAAGVIGGAISRVPVHPDRVGRIETWVFQRVNRLPDGLLPPTWLLMQAGTLGAVPVSAAVAYRLGRPRLSGQLLAGGSTAWALAKVVKRYVQRPRPAELILDTRIRGSEASGLGYVSGHAGVVTAMGMTLWPVLGRDGRFAIASLVCVVGLGRVYVGAHFPLDVVGGIAVGVVVNAGVTAALPGRD
jgi:undecaprenyl-diphosphatase